MIGKADKLDAYSSRIESAEVNDLSAVMKPSQVKKFIGQNMKPDVNHKSLISNKGSRKKDQNLQPPKQVHKGLSIGQNNYSQVRNFVENNFSPPNSPGRKLVYEQYNPCDYDPNSLDDNKEEGNLAQWHKKLQNQREDEQKLRIIKLVDTQVRRLTKNWVYDTKQSLIQIQKLLKTIKSKIQSVSDKGLIFEHAHKLIIDLEKMLVQGYQRLGKGKENDQSQSNNIIKESKKIQKHKDQCPQEDNLHDQENQGQKQFAKIQEGKFCQQQMCTQSQILIGDQSIHEIIISKLKDKGIKCVIRAPYQIFGSKIASNYSVLYHNSQLVELIKVISQYDDLIQFSLISFTSYLKLIKRSLYNQMNENDLKSLGLRLNHKYPNEILSLWQFINESNELEYYISTGSQESLLYIYIVMTQLKEESSFQNPKDLETLCKQQLEKRFKKIFPAGQSKGYY